MINNLQNELNEYKINDTNLFKEISIIFPELKEVSLGRHISHITADSTQTTMVFIYQTERKKTKIDTEKLKQWLRQKLKVQDIRVIQQ